MKKNLVMTLTALASLAAGAASMGCIFAFLDEPKMPNKML